MRTENITWHELPQDGMPDAEDAVLLETFTTVAEGWWDGMDWRWAESGGVVEQSVRAWARMPEGVEC